MPTNPTPVVVTTICSMCGLDWERHGADPTTEDCVRLLKAELARRPVTIPMPYPMPYQVGVRPFVPLPYPHAPQSPLPGRPIWGSEPHITCTTIQGTPRLSAAACEAMS